MTDYAELIRDLYFELLLREPKPREIDFWRRRLREGLTPVKLRRLIQLSRQYNVRWSGRP